MNKQLPIEFAEALHQVMETGVLPTSTIDALNNALDEDFNSRLKGLLGFVGISDTLLSLVRKNTPYGEQGVRVVEI